MLLRTLALTLAATTLLVPSSSPAAAAPDSYNPSNGPSFNNPLGGRFKRRVIFRTIVRSINSSPRGSEIDIFTWNFATSEGTDALIRAQRRGVRVRLLMDVRNLRETGNPLFTQLRATLRRGNEGRAKNRRSYARVCVKTCRGRRGAAHTKMFLFSDVGKRKRVVMQGSANFTVASTTNQWNDMYTHVGNHEVYRFAKEIFQEAARDRPAARPYADEVFNGFRLIAFPMAKQRDPVGEMLDRVKCKKATNTRSGRTRIMIAPDVMRQSRGMALGRQVRALWERGCDVRIGYTVMGIDVGQMLRRDTGRGRVPMKHLVQDLNGDGQFDNYFHLKSMTIVGHYGKDRSAHALLNGSANWSNLARVSDENLGIYSSKRAVLQYEQYLDHWYRKFPDDGRARSTPDRRVAADRPLVFGFGEHAVYEDGRPLGYNPFTEMALD